MFAHARTLSDTPLILEHDLNMEYVSPLFHELTHFDCLNSDFGCALILGLQWLKKRLGDFSDDDLLKTAEGSEIPFQKRDMMIARLLPNLGCAIPILEGMATFYQLDYLPSSQYDISTCHFNTALYLLTNAVGPHSRASTAHLNPQPLINRVNTLFTELHTFNLVGQELFYTTHFKVIRNNSYYLFGYIYVKTMIQLLIDHDKRFQDTESAYVFLRNYLFNGSDLRHGHLSPFLFMSAYQDRFELLKRTESPVVARLADMLAVGEIATGYNTIDVYDAMKYHQFIKPDLIDTIGRSCRELALDPSTVIPFIRGCQFMSIKVDACKVAYVGLDDDDPSNHLAEGGCSVLLLSSAVSGMMLRMPVRKAVELARSIEHNGRRFLSRAELMNFLETGSAPLGLFSRVWDVISTESNSFQDALATLMIDSITGLPVQVIGSGKFAYSSIEIIRNGSSESTTGYDELNKQLEWVNAYLSIEYRKDLTKFIFDLFCGRDFSYISGRIMDVNAFVYYNMMNVSNATRLSSLVETGFSLIGLSAKDIKRVALQYDPVKRQFTQMTQKLNALLRWPYY